MKNIIILSIILGLPACSNQQLYNMVNGRAKQQCYQLPQSEVNDCIERNNDNYNEYKRKKSENSAD